MAISTFIAVVVLLGETEGHRTNTKEHSNIVPVPAPSWLQQVPCFVLTSLGTVPPVGSPMSASTSRCPCWPWHAGSPSCIGLPSSYFPGIFSSRPTKLPPSSRLHTSDFMTALPLPASSVSTTLYEGYWFLSGSRLPLLSKSVTSRFVPTSIFGRLPRFPAAASFRSSPSSSYLVSITAPVCQPRLPASASPHPCVSLGCHLFSLIQFSMFKLQGNELLLRSCPPIYN